MNLSTSLFSRGDTAVCLACNRWARRKLVRGFFGVISRVGDGAIWYAMLVAIALADGLHGLTASVHMALTGIVALTIYRVLKSRSKRLRPFAADPRIHALARPLDEFSFPSGHTLHAVAFSVVAISYYPMLAWPLIPLCAAIAASRVVLGLHYPSDVLAGFTIGAAIGLASIAI